MKAKIVAVITVLVVFFAAAVFGGIPQEIGYQGYLTNSSGVPVNGAVSLTFSLYSSEAGTDPLWTRTDNITVDKGIYHVALGPLSLPFDIQYFLGVKYGTEAEMTPRQPLQSVPYAMRAAVADAVSGGVTTTGGADSNVLLTPSGNGIVDVNGKRVGNLAAPVQPTDAATKQYVDSKGTGISWQRVTTNTAAAPNSGYLVDSPSQVTITLPASPAIGDIVRVTGIGSGGWRIAQNAGQVVDIEALRENSLLLVYRCAIPSVNKIVSSFDGTKVAAATQDGIYTSADSGVTWTIRQAGTPFSSIASSTDGSKLVATVQGGQVYTSTDSGATWTGRESIRNWSAVASSSDGVKLVAVVWGGQIYTSADSGVTWIPRETNRDWRSVDSSADGTKLVVINNSGPAYNSTDSGDTWSEISTGNSYHINSSADGTILVGSYSVSHDSGSTWDYFTGDFSFSDISADGSIILFATEFGINLSNDGGATWKHWSDTHKIYALSLSGDGTKVAAFMDNGGDNGDIYTFSITNSAGFGISLKGDRKSAIELQYIGNGTFIPISSTGTISL